jgi:hypothetical protein
LTSTAATRLHFIPVEDFVSNVKKPKLHLTLLILLIQRCETGTAEANQRLDA